MGKEPGNKSVIRKGNVPIAGIREINYSVDGSPIDSTDQNDVEYGSFLNGEMVDRRIVISVSGLEADGVLQGIALGEAAGYFLSDIALDLATTGKTITGNFVFGGYQSGMPYKEATTFSCTFTSNADWAIADTPATP